MTPEERFEGIETALLRITQANERLIVTVSQLAETVSHYVDAADRRMQRIEENLDGLIRAITAEHRNGKEKQ